MNQPIRPVLWFESQAHEAAEFYTGIIKNSKISSVGRWGDEGPGKAGDVMVVIFELNGVDFMALNGVGGMQTAPAFYIHCDDQAEIDRYWERLSEGGKPGVCGWLEDRFGVSWNVVPRIFETWMSEGTPEQTQRMLKAVFGMKKLDIATLQAAFEGR